MAMDGGSHFNRALMKFALAILTAGMIAILWIAFAIIDKIEKYDGN